MIEITLFGSFVGTLASGLSVVLLLAALASVTFLAATGIAAARRGALPMQPSGAADRGIRAVGIGIAACALLAALFGLRVTGAGTDTAIVPTIAVSLAAAAAIGSSGACAWAFGGRTLAALGEASARRDAELRLAQQTRVQQIEQRSRGYLEGWDLRAEVAQAGAALTRLRAAFGALVQARDSLEQQLASPEAQASADLAAEIRRARDDVAMKVDLGQRVLEGAEQAAFRLACNEPLRRITRRRPRGATLTLTSGGGASGAGAGERAERASLAIEAFLSEVREAHAWLDALDGRRPATIPAGGELDPVERTRRELGAMENAYTAILQRLQVVRLQLATHAGAIEMANAAGAVSSNPRAAEVDQAELAALITEVTRAESAIAITAPEGDSRVLTEALARGAIALDRSDAASLEELCAAFRTMR
jgi:hypothetical protein